MPAQKNRRPIKEDAYDTPSASRGGMMKVAGASDDVEAGDELLSDCAGDPDEYVGKDTVGAYLYPREGVARVRLGDLRHLIASTILSV